MCILRVPELGKSLRAAMKFTKKELSSRCALFYGQQKSAANNSFVRDRMPPEDKMTVDTLRRRAFQDRWLALVKS